MAVQQPRARIVFRECDGEVAVGWERSNIAARRVNEVDVRVGEGEGARCLADDPEIMAVEMDGVEEA